MHERRMRHHGHYGLIGPETAEGEQARFWGKVERRADGVCWPWRGTILDTGYGQFKARNRRHMAHRYMHELMIGPIPAGFHIDHVASRGCIRKDCVNPSHLEAVTPAENTRRAALSVSTLNAAKTHCPKGHDYTQRKRARVCQTCDNERARAARPRARRKAAAH